MAVVQPFADLDFREESIPLVPTEDSGPARCSKCRAYINPWCRWVAGGAKWKCNLCESENTGIYTKSSSMCTSEIWHTVSSGYFCNLDANLLRLDHTQRPELNKGTVDFVVPKQYWASPPPPRIEPLYHPILARNEPSMREPKPMDLIFVIEVTAEAVSSGFTRQVCRSIDTILYGANGLCLPPGRVSIVTFDRTLHFYDLTVGIFSLLH